MTKQANISFRADISNLRKELKKIPGVTDVESKRMVRKLTAQLKKAERESTKAWKAARKKGPQKYGKSVAGLKGIFTAVIGGVAVQQVGRLVSKFADLNDQINQTAKEAREVGSTAEEYQRVEGAIDLLTRGGVNAADTIAKLRRGIAEAQDGTVTYVDALDKLGLQADEVARLPLDDQLAVVADALAGVSSRTEQTQIAMDLLGRSGAKLLPAFENGSEAFKKAADQIGGVGSISNEAAEEAEKLADAGHLLGLEWRGLASDLLTEISPALQGATEDIQSMIRAARESGAIEDLGASISGLINEDSIKLLGDATSATVEATKATNDLLDLWNIGTTLSMGIWLDALYSWKDGGEKYQRTIDNLEDSMFRLMVGTEAAAAEQRAMRDDFDDSAASARGYNQVLDEQLDRLVALGLVDPAKPEQEDKPKRPGTSPGDGLEKKLEKVRATLREHHGEVRNMDWSYRSQADEQWQRTQDLQLKGIQDLEAEKERAHKDQLERDREEAESAHQMYLSMLDHSQTYANTIGTIQGAITRMIVDGTEEGTEARRKAEQDAFIASKIAASANIVVSTAAAVAKANEITPPGNIPAMIAAAGVGVAQLAVVAAEQPTFHTGGEVQATLEAGEHVSSRQAVRNAGGHEALDQLERGNGPMAGGRFTVIQQVNNRTTFAAEYEAIRTGASPYSAELAAMQPERRGLRNPYAEA